MYSEEKRMRLARAVYSKHGLSGVVLEDFCHKKLLRRLREYVGGRKWYYNGGRVITSTENKIWRSIEKKIVWV